MAADPRAGLRARLSRMGLARQIALFGTVPILIGISASLVALNVEVRRQTKHLLRDAIEERQALIADVQERRAEQRFRLSALVLDSPTLRAALDTYRVERQFGGGASRVELAETVRAEAQKAAATLDTDLLAILDESGAVLAAAGVDAIDAFDGSGLASRPAVRRALDPGFRFAPDDAAVLEIEGTYYRVSAVPIVLQDFLLGALVVGDRIDSGYLDDLAGLFSCELSLAVDGVVVASTLDAVERATVGAVGGDAGDVVRLAGEEFVASRLPLGGAGDDREVALYVLDSLTGALTRSRRASTMALLGAGAFALLLACGAAWLVSRSLLRPLERFVAFMRAETVDGGGRRFESPAAAKEVRELAAAYNSLSDALQERKRRDLEQLDRLKESEKLAALGRLLSGAAHEINNPLTGVVGNIEMVLHERGLDERNRGRLETVRREGRRIVGLVRNLLKVAHRQTDERSTFDVRVPLRETVELRRHDFAAAGIALDVELPDAELPVDGNDLELQQVFLNILNNAYDALTERGGDGSLVVSAAGAGASISIEFSDDGPGLTDPQQVFEHFYTTKPVGKGTGLGLSITHAIVRRHGGEIAAENRPEGGARFTVELPRASENAARPAPPARETAEVSHVEPLRASVLVADDEPSVLELQLAILDAFGAHAVGVPDGEAAVAELERRSFDLVVSDMKMPGRVSGKELHRWVEIHRPEMLRGFVFVTGDTIEESAFLQEPGRRFLLKPFAMDEYVATLRAALRAIRKAA